MECAQEGSIIHLKEHKEETMEVQFTAGRGGAANCTDFYIHRCQTAQRENYGGEICRRTAANFADFNIHRFKTAQSINHEVTFAASRRQTRRLQHSSELAQQATKTNENH